MRVPSGALMSQPTYSTRAGGLSVNGAGDEVLGQAAARVVHAQVAHRPAPEVQHGVAVAGAFAAGQWRLGTWAQQSGFKLVVRGDDRRRLAPAVMLRSANRGDAVPRAGWPPSAPRWTRPSPW